jgi:pimeloyl-ACP methyl ester carboxylesterase
MHLARQNDASITLPAAEAPPAPEQAIAPTLPSGKVARLTPALKAYTAAIRTMDRVAPGLTTELLHKLFVRPRRRRGGDYRKALPAGHRRLAIDYRGQALTGWSWGDRGPAVLLVHGWEDHSGAMLKLVEPLHRRGYRVMVMDAPGHGLSPTMDTHLLDTGNALAALLEQTGGCRAIIAHSYGAAATALMLHRQPQWMPDHLTLVSPMQDIHQHLSIFAGIARLSPDAWTRLQQRVLDTVGHALEDLSTLQAAAGLDAPGLIIHDRKDPLIPYAISARLAERWPGAEVIATEGLGHRRTLSCPKVVEEILTRLDGVLAPARTPSRLALETGS